MPYSATVFRAWALCGPLLGSFFGMVVVAASSSLATAGGLVVSGGSPRAIGRAGTGTVGDDGGGALLVNPAAMARRDAARAQVGLAFTDDEIAWRGARDAPIARNQSASDISPIGAVIGSIGPWVIGAGVMTSSVSDRSLRRPSDLPPDELGASFEFRYAGIAGAIQRDTITVGVARRIGDTVAVGIAVGASRVTVSETRRLWAGFAGRDPIGDPELDVEVSMAGTDAFAPSAVAGILIAPAEEPIELGASIAWADRLGIDADVDASTADTVRSPSVALSAPTARLALRQPWTIRAGGRYLGERFVAELGGDLWIAAERAALATWKVDGIRVIDRSGVESQLAAIPSRASMRTHGAVRGAVDVELIGGFLWATSGYAYTIGGVDGRRQSPTFGDLGGHTLALGLEVSVGGFTVTTGWARTWSVAHRVGSALALDNPFRAGEQAVPTGTYDGSIDQIGIMIDAELDAAE